MPWMYNPKTLSFEEMPPPPPPTYEGVNYNPEGVENPLLEIHEAVQTTEPTAIELANTIYEYQRNATQQYQGGPSLDQIERDRDSASRSLTTSATSTSSPSAPRFTAENPPRADDILPGSSLLSDIPAPPGYAWAIDPLTGKAEAIDLTPLDVSQPLAGWKWIPDDPSNPKKGKWEFFPTPDVLDDPFAGIPQPVIGWLQTALDAGGDLSVVPEGPAREWVNFILTQATNPGRPPGTVPFGTGLPNFIRTGASRPEIPEPPTSASTQPADAGGDNKVQTIIDQVNNLLDRFGNGDFPLPPSGDGGTQDTTPSAAIDRIRRLREALRNAGFGDEEILDILARF